MTPKQQQAMERLKCLVSTWTTGTMPLSYEQVRAPLALEADIRTLLSAVPTWVEKPTVPGMYFVLASPGTWNLLTLFPGDESEVSLPVYGPVPGYAQPATEGK